MFKIHSSELAENTIMLYEELIPLSIIHFSKIRMLTEPLTAISVMVMNGIIIMAIYVNEMGIMALKYVKGMLKTHIRSTNWNV